MTHHAKGRREDDDFVKLAHLLQELVHARPLYDVDIVQLVFYQNRDHIIWNRQALRSVVNGSRAMISDGPA